MKFDINRLLDDPCITEDRYEFIKNYLFFTEDLDSSQGVVFLSEDSSFHRLYHKLQELGSIVPSYEQFLKKQEDQEILYELILAVLIVKYHYFEEKSGPSAYYDYEIYSDIRHGRYSEEHFKANPKDYEAFLDMNRLNMFSINKLIDLLKDYWNSQI